MPTKVYVRIIDGVEDWVPVNAIASGRLNYTILDDAEYIDDDPTVLFEFYPGDIVWVEDSMEEEYEFKAIKLIKLSDQPDRKYLYFKFYATLRYMPISIETAAEFADVIKRIRQEIDSGQFMYRGIKETITALEQIS
ncbi:MAG: hypothetical protein R3D00_28015 [Bacteroidia bacterium]